MTVDQRFGITIAALTLVFLVLSTIVGLLVKVIIRWTHIEDRMDAVAKDITDLVDDKDKVHREMINQMREDRHATNERLTYLERSVWPKSRRQ